MYRAYRATLELDIDALVWLAVSWWWVGLVHVSVWWLALVWDWWRKWPISSSARSDW